MSETGIDRRDDVHQLRLAHSIELLASAIDAVHRLDSLGIALDRLVDLARQVATEPYALLVVSAGSDSCTVGCRSSGSLDDELASTMCLSVAEYLDQLEHEELTGSRLVQIPVRNAPEGALWSFQGVPIFRRGTRIGALGLVTADSEYMLSIDEIRILELLAQCTGTALDLSTDQLRM